MTTINTKLRTIRIAGLGEVSILFYGDAKQNNIKQNDVITVSRKIGNVIMNTIFTVREYIKYDTSGRNVSGFRLIENN